MISQQFIHENIIRFNANISRFLGKKENIYIKTWIDEILSFVLFGASPDDYFRYEFYRKSLYERNKFITYRRSKKIIKNYNSSDTVSNQLMCDKGKQNRHFKDFLRREWIDIDFCTNEQMTAFFKKHKRVIMKPKDGSGGKGIFILTEREFNDKGENLGAYTGYLAEQLLIQHPQMASLNPTSVNTLRVITFRGQIISCALKIGTGSAVVDNMSSGGIYGNVNLEYGFTDSLFMDINLKKYAYHPQTHAKLIGFEIPLWDKVKKTIHDAAQAIPDVQYVGWDVAVLPEGVAIIEANKAPGHDLSKQSSIQFGLYETIKNVIKN